MSGFSQLSCRGTQLPTTVANLPPWWVIGFPGMIAGRIRSSLRRYLVRKVGPQYHGYAQFHPPAVDGGAAVLGGEERLADFPYDFKEVLRTRCEAFPRAGGGPGG